MNKTHLRQSPYKQIFLFLLLAIMLSACGAKEIPAEALGEGPKTWIEYPPEGEIFSMRAIPIMIYSAGSSGGQDISVEVGGQILPAGEISSLSESGTLLRDDLLWQPPAEGKYVIYASTGNGIPAKLTFCVVNCDEPSVEANLPTSTPAITSTLPIITLPPAEISTMPVADSTFTPAPTKAGAANVSFSAAPPYINQGECTTLNWNVTGNFQTVYLEGTPVNANGSDSECPAQSYIYHLQVVEMDSTTSDYWTTVEVYATEIPTDTPLPPADSTGPNISWTNLVWGNCQFSGQAGISDESGVSWAKFYYNKDGEGWNSIWMSGSDTWQSDLGVSVGDGTGTVIPGSIEYYINAVDNLGNESTSGTSSYNYGSCDG